MQSHQILQANQIIQGGWLPQSAKTTVLREPHQVSNKNIPDKRAKQLKHHPITKHLAMNTAFCPSPPSPEVKCRQAVKEPASAALLRTSGRWSPKQLKAAWAPAWRPRARREAPGWGSPVGEHGREGAPIQDTWSRPVGACSCQNHRLKQVLRLNRRLRSRELSLHQ